MGSYTQPQLVKLVIGILAKNEEFSNRAVQKLCPIFGKKELIHPAVPFTWTNYYQKEVGTSPIRAFISFEDLVSRENFVGIKRLTNAMEDLLRENGLRPVNLDPGYLTLGQFFLASTKDQRQRVYLGGGVFLEPTLFFKDGEFHPFHWTYRDYRSPEYLEYFKKARSKLAFQLRAGYPYSKRKQGIAGEL